MGHGPMDLSMECAALSSILLKNHQELICQRITLLDQRIDLLN
jgi:hypothetical protein